MRIFCLMRVESSFAGSASTGILRMTPSSGDNHTSFSIKYLRLMGAVTSLDLVQSLLTRVDLNCLLCAMTLKIFSLLVNMSELDVAVWVHRLYGFCTLEAALCTLTSFLRTNTSCVLQAACVYGYVCCTQSCFCVLVRLVRYKRLIHMNTYLHAKRLIVYIYNLCSLRGSCI